MMIPWLDQGFPVMGYFYEDSADGWVSRCSSFAITRILDPGGVDSLVVDPPRPTDEDSITLSLYMPIYTCCTSYNPDSVGIDGREITLFYSQPLMDCMCLPFWHTSQTDYGLSPLPPGTYDIYIQENAACLNPPCLGPIGQREFVDQLTVLDASGTVTASTNPGDRTLAAPALIHDGVLVLDLSGLEALTAAVRVLTPGGRLIGGWQGSGATARIPVGGAARSPLIVDIRAGGRTVSQLIVR
jgi:hypothetical protein